MCTAMRCYNSPSVCRATCADQQQHNRAASDDDANWQIAKGYKQACGRSWRGGGGAALPALPCCALECCCFLLQTTQMHSTAAVARFVVLHGRPILANSRLSSARGANITTV
jgi:hypothetical protein